MWDCPSCHTLQINIHVCETVPGDAHCRSTYMYVRLSQLTRIADQHVCETVPVDAYYRSTYLYMRLPQLMYILGWHTCRCDCPSCQRLKVSRRLKLGLSQLTHSRSTYMHETVPVDAHEHTSWHVSETVPLDACCIWAYMYVRLSHLTHILGQHTCMKLSQLMHTADEHTYVWDCPSWCTLQMNIHVCETAPVDTHGPADMWDCPIWPTFQVTWHDTVPSETYGKSADMSACPT